MKRFIAAVSLALLAGSALAVQHSGSIERSPLDRRAPGIRIPLERDPVDVRDPLMHPRSAGAPLPDLPGSVISNPFGDMHARPLPGERAPLVGAPQR
jgi:hypothetical protein